MMGTARLHTHEREYIAKRASCPQCGASCPRHSLGSRSIRELTGVSRVAYSKHYCRVCRKHFSNFDPGVVGKGALYSNDFKLAAVRLLRMGSTLESVSKKFKVPLSTLAEWKICAASESA